MLVFCDSMVDEERKKIREIQTDRKKRKIDLGLGRDISFTR